MTRTQLVNAILGPRYTNLGAVGVALVAAARGQEKR